LEENGRETVKLMMMMVMMMRMMMMVMISTMPSIEI